MVTATALTPVTAACWDRARALAIANEFPEVHQKLDAAMARNLGLVLERLHLVSEGRVAQRLARAVLELAERHGEPDSLGIVIAPPLTRKDVASVVGTSLFTASRLLSQWEDDGLVSSSRAHLRIHSIEGLRAIADAPLRLTPGLPAALRVRQITIYARGHETTRVRNHGRGAPAAGHGDGGKPGTCGTREGPPRHPDQPRRVPGRRARQSADAGADTPSARARGRACGGGGPGQPRGDVAESHDVRHRRHAGQASGDVQRPAHPRRLGPAEDRAVASEARDGEGADGVRRRAMRRG